MSKRLYSQTNDFVGAPPRPAKRARLTISEREKQERRQSVENNKRKWSEKYQIGISMDQHGWWCTQCKWFGSQTSTYAYTKKSDKFLEHSKTAQHQNAHKAYMEGHSAAPWSSQKLLKFPKKSAESVDEDRLRADIMLENTARMMYYADRQRMAKRKAPDNNRLLHMFGVPTTGDHYTAPRQRNEWTQASSMVIEEDTDDIFWNKCESRFIGIDASTSRGHVKVLDLDGFCVFENRVYELFLGYLELPNGRGGGVNIFKTIYKWLAKKGKTFLDVCGWGVDGASEMLNTFAKEVLKVNPCSLIHWCFSHRDNLSKADVFKMLFWKIHNGNVDAISNFIRLSTANTHVLHKKQEEMEQKILNMKRVCPSRWTNRGLVAKSFAVNRKAISRSLVTISNDISRESGARTKAGGFAGYVIKAECVVLNSVQTDFLEVHNEWAVKLQKRDLFSGRLTSLKDKYLAKVTAVLTYGTRDGHGEFVRKLFEDFRVEDDHFFLGAEELSTRGLRSVSGIQERLGPDDVMRPDGYLHQVMNITRNSYIQSYESRWPSRSTTFFDRARIFDPIQIPSDAPATYGCDDLRAIFNKVFVPHCELLVDEDWVRVHKPPLSNVPARCVVEALLSDENIDRDDGKETEEKSEDEKIRLLALSSYHELEEEYHRFREAVSDLTRYQMEAFKKNHGSSMKAFLDRCGGEFIHIRRVINYFQCFSGSNAGPESVFSTMNDIIGTQKCSSGITTLVEWLTRIARNGPFVDKLDVKRVVGKWKLMSERRDILQVYLPARMTPSQIQVFLDCGVAKDEGSIFSKEFPF